MTIDSAYDIVKKVIDISLVWIAFYYILKNIRNNVKLTLLFKGVAIASGNDAVVTEKQSQVIGGEITILLL